MNLTSNGIHGRRKSAKTRGPRSRRNRFRPMVLDRLEERLLLAAPTTLSVASAAGIYGGTATVSATLTTGAVDIAGESVDFHLGAVDLGPAITGNNGIASIAGVSLAGNNVGTFTGDVTASFEGDVNFDPANGSNDLTVNAAPLTITANNQSKVYGAALPTLTASYTGFVNGDTSASLATPPTITTTATAASHVSGSPYAITASAAVDTDYTISYVAGSLAVTTAPLTITANNLTKVYGAALPSLTASYTGFVNGDTSASLATPPTITTTATAASHLSGSPYSITASGAVDTDYTISYVAGTLSVTKAPLTITANNLTKVYGAALPTLTFGYSGFVNGDTSASLATLPTITTTATAASNVAGSPYAITASGAVDTDYTISYVAGSLTVTAAPLTITADDQTKVYGAALPTLTTSFLGFVNGDTSANLTTAPTITTTATAASHVAGNPYAITASGAVDTDYTISYVPGSLTITAAPLTITADNQTSVYGAELPTLTSSFSGFVNDDTSASLATLPTLSTTATSGSHVAGSPYAITASGAVDTDYTISYVPGSLTITAAPLTITADNQTSVYGADLPTLTSSFSCLVIDDTSASLATLPTLSTTADATSHVSGSPYPITASGAVDPNYTFTYVPGNLTVTTAPLTITANDVTSTFGHAIPPLTATYTGFVNGDTSASLTTPVSLTTTASSTSNVGSYPVVASGATSSDYTVSYTNGSVSVTPATLTVTPNDVSKAFGATLPTLTATYSGFVNGDTAASLTTPVTLSTTATASSAVGTYPITATGGSSTDYTIVDGQGTLTVPTVPTEVAFVTSIYQAILGRAPETAGLDGFLAELDNGATQSHVIGQIYNSPEAVADRAAQGVTANPQAPGQIGLVTALYQTILGRTPELAGLAGWQALLQSGASPADVAVLIFNSPEAVADRADTMSPIAPTNTQEVGLVTALYQTILNRTPETAGLDGWLAQLNSGTSGASVATQIYEAPEAVADRAALTPPTDAGRVAFVTSLYQNILGRTPEAGGLDGWLTQLIDGLSPTSVASQIYASPEGVAYRTTHAAAISEMNAYTMALQAQMNVETA